jgi:hypothetical protein
MNELANKLFHGTSSLASSTKLETTHHLLLRQTAQDPHITGVSSINQPQNTAAIYTIQTTKKTLILYRGSPTSQHKIGECETAFMGLSMDVTLHDSQFSIRNSATATKFIVQSPSYGRLEWKGDSLLGSGLSLYNISGEKVATIKSGGIMNRSERQLLVFVHCDVCFLEMVLLTAVAAMKLDKRADEIAYKLLGESS